MDILLIIFTALLISAFILQILMYSSTSESKKQQVILAINVTFVFLLSFFAFSSLPSNYTIEKSIAIVWPFIAVFAVLLKFKNASSPLNPKLILTIAMLGALIQAIFV